MTGLSDTFLDILTRCAAALGFTGLLMACLRERHRRDVYEFEDDDEAPAWPCAAIGGLQ